jgi:hypothetical protein
VSYQQPGWGPPPQAPRPRGMPTPVLIAVSVGIATATIVACVAFLSWGGRNVQRNAAATPIAAVAIPAAAPPVSARACDPRVAVDGRIRDRWRAAEYVGRAIGLLRIVNAGGRVDVLGWDATDSELGPPCYATFAYDLNGSRRTARFKFWPQPTPRLAPFNSEAADMVDLVDTTVPFAGGGPPTRDQLGAAMMLRVTSGMNAEDAYLSPSDNGVIVIRRQHCVVENVDFRVAPDIVRLFRHAHITRVQCEADAAWAFDVPPRGTPPPPYLLTAPPR